MRLEAIVQKRGVSIARQGGDPLVSAIPDCWPCWRG